MGEESQQPRERRDALEKHRVALEICVDTPGGAAIAADAGADRIELCAGLALGGLTPGPGLIAAARSANLPAHAMIRPRAGGFLASETEIDAMLADIAAMRAAGLAGVVIGLTRGGALDRDGLARLVEAAGPMQVTLHRAIDTLADPTAALEVAVEVGFARILTSGGAATAPEGLTGLQELVRAARGRIEIMAGGGITPASVHAVIETGVDAVHASCGTEIASDDGFGFGAERRTDAGRVAALARAVRQGKVTQCA